MIGVGSRTGREIRQDALLRAAPDTRAGAVARPPGACPAGVHGSPSSRSVARLRSIRLRAS
jgi:hypothetical protein